MATTETKTCTHCHRELPLTAFGKSTRTKDGYQYWCNFCRAESAHNSYVKKKAEKAERMRLNTEALAAAPAGTTEVTTADGRRLRRVSADCKPLSEYKPNELLAELKSRGYVWKEMYVRQYIEYSKI